MNTGKKNGRRPNKKKSGIHLRRKKRKLKRLKKRKKIKNLQLKKKCHLGLGREDAKIKRKSRFSHTPTSSAETEKAN